MRHVVCPSTEYGSTRFKWWLAKHHGSTVTESFPHDSAYGYGIVNDDDEIEIASVIQPFYMPGSYLVSYFGDNPRLFFSKKLIRESFLVPFRPPFNAVRITCILNSVHERSVECAKRIGFSEEGRLRKHFTNTDSDGVILGLARDDIKEW